MDFSDERYVRVYIRDTATWNLLEWEGQTVFVLLMRKFDRVGLLDISDGLTAAEAIQAVIKVPAPVVDVGLAKLLKYQVLVVDQKRIMSPKFLEAQEARQSDAARQRDSRARKRDLARAELMGVTIRDTDEPTTGIHRVSDVTKRDSSSPPPAPPPIESRVTKRDSPTAGVTHRPKSGENVTLSPAQPSRTDSSYLKGSSQPARHGPTGGVTAGAAAALAESGPEAPLPRRPVRQADPTCSTPIDVADYEPLPEHQEYAGALGLDEAGFTRTLEEFRTKGRYRRKTVPSVLDGGFCSYLETAAQQTRPRRLRLEVVEGGAGGAGGGAPRGPAPAWVPPTENAFRGEMARHLFADDDDIEEGREA